MEYSIEERIVNLQNGIRRVEGLLNKSNTCHIPNGPKGGQFCAAGSGTVFTAGSGNAARYSRAADRASAKAQQKGTSAAHRSAEKAHRLAVSANSLEGKGDKVSYHQSKAEYHGNTANVKTWFR